MRRSTEKLVWLVRSRRDKSYLINGISFVVVNDTYLAGVRKFNHLGIFNINDVFDGQRDLDAVAVIVTSEYDSLKALHPFFGTRCAVGSEVVSALTADNFKLKPILVTVSDTGRDAKPEVNLAVREI